MGDFYFSRATDLTTPRSAPAVVYMVFCGNASILIVVMLQKNKSMLQKKAKARMLYKTLNNIGPESLTKLFHCKNETTKYNLRNISGSLCLPQPRTNSMKNSFMYDGAKLWNSIPKEIRESKSLSCFQNKIATHAF